MTAEAVRRNPRRQGLQRDTGAPLTAAPSLGGGEAAGFGDGVIRVFRQDQPPGVIAARRLAVAHHGGATDCTRGARRWGSSKLLRKGSHRALAEITAADVAPALPGPCNGKRRREKTP